jgi:hypothetical protein
MQKTLICLSKKPGRPPFCGNRHVKTYEKSKPTLKKFNDRSSTSQTQNLIQRETKFRTQNFGLHAGEKAHRKLQG